MNQPAVAPSDFELQQRSIRVRGTASDVVVSEFTLRQRDSIGTYVKGLAATDLGKLIQSLFGKGSALAGENVRVEIDIPSFVQSVAEALSEGKLTELIVLLVDNPDNRDLFDGNVREWCLDHLRLRDELAIINAVLEVNDFADYLGKLSGLMSGAITASTQTVDVNNSKVEA